MKKIAFVFAAASLCDSAAYAAEYGLWHDTVLWADEFVDSPVNVNNSLHLENRGVIAGDVFVCDGCELTLRNSGEIRGTVYLDGARANLIQKIETNADITRIDVDGQYAVQVGGGDEILDWARVSDAVGAAGMIMLQDAQISLSDAGGVVSPAQMRMRMASPILTLKGTITLYVDDVYVLRDRLLFDNVDADANIAIRGDNSNPLYVASAELIERQIYLRLLRKTDYYEILGNNAGRFLNALRAARPTDKTMAALDGAETMPELNNIMSRSAALNPIKLMRPIQVFERFAGGSDSGKLGAEYIVGNGFDIRGVSAGASTDFDDLNFAFSIYSGDVSGADEINDFDGSFYGAKISASYNIKTLYVHSAVAYTISEFSDIMVFDGENATHNPRGKSYSMAMDVGANFYIDDEIYLRPFGGAGFNRAAILHQSENDSFARIGAVAGMKSDVLGIVNDVNMFGFMQTNNVLIGGIRADFWSVADNAGGGLSYAIMRDDIGISHKFAAEFRFKF
ncbi:MAG: autotransporter domain-containing protein [Rickettsiales bacterium]|jgi:hypothetical protein|nr:autotransporter domain-containing protein [Rickettsiales bacterium]